MQRSSLPNNYGHDVVLQYSC